MLKATTNLRLLSTMPKAAPTPSFPLNGMFPVAKPTGPTS
jgi:hypothetical protein